MPAVLLAPSADLAARQWKRLYDSGKASAPPLAVTCAACFSFLAYHGKFCNSNQTCIPLTSRSARGIPGKFALSPSTLYLSAAILAPSIVPYTILVMMPTVKTLESKARDDAKAPSDTETISLVQKWSGQNVHRALMVAASALLGGAAILAGA